MKIKDIINNLQNICRETDITPGDDCLFENAVKIYISNKIGESKKVNIDLMKESKQQDIPKATDKQVKFLIQLGYMGEINTLTKEEAKALISELKARKQNGTE